MVPVLNITTGRSTLENELVGDIGAEFGSSPERPEEMSLDELSQNLQTCSGFSGKLGKTTKTLVSKLISLKMPGGCSLSVLRSYLNDQWGLSSGRQDSIFLKACAALPTSRLGSMKEVHSLLDQFVQEYCKENALDLEGQQSAGPGNGANTTAALPFDNRILEKSNKDRDDMMKKKMELYAQALGVDLQAADRAAAEARNSINSLQRQVDTFNSEMGDVFTTGIKPQWSTKKVRRFDSYWNWVVQETLELFYSVLLGKPEMSTSEMASRSIRIANRSNERLLSVIQYLMSSSPETWGPRSLIAKGVLSEVLQLCEATKNPCYRPLFSFQDTCIKSPRTEIDMQGNIKYDEVPRAAWEQIAPVHIETKQSSGWEKNKKLSDIFSDQIQNTRHRGLSFKSRTALLTGASPGSIGSEILIGLLSGSCRVIVTTSSYSPEVVNYYQKLYEKHGARGSELVVAPFNQGSVQDLDSLVSYIFDPANGLGWDLDYIVPFAAIPELGQIDNIDSKSELAHRIMLTHTIRLLGAVKRQKEMRGIFSHPVQLILPLSPNHGAFGNDGLYAESKIGLESLFDKWHSEDWAPYISILGAVIGWTRGTGLMTDNNVVAAGIENLGVRTFSQAEMALYILVLMSRPMVIQTEIQPLYADLTGGLNSVKNLKLALSKIRRDISDTSNLRRSIAKEERLEEMANISYNKSASNPTQVLPRANIQIDFPKLPDLNELDPLRQKLNGMVDLDRVVVVTGFSEVGPWGNSRTRWEMEAFGHFSIEGCVEMAWIMGLIKHHNGPLEGRQYIGWIDTKTSKPVHDFEVKANYESQILSSSGIRLIEPELDNGYDPSKKFLMQETQLNEDMPPFLAPTDVAEQMAREHGDKVHLSPGEDGFTVHLKKGATLYIPKALKFDRTVAGQIPAGWDARTYGISEEIIQSVDRVTLFALVSTVEALLASGITDPYELYKYIHVSEVGNCIGSGMGGMVSQQKIYQSRLLDKPASNDALAESFINTTSAWVNMLLLSSSGPIRTPVGACATSIESLETGFETIVSGKAKMCLVGGHDDMNEVTSYEFANMKATSSAVDEFERGRTPQDMSRPATTTRAGFMEAQGSGNQILTTARLALDMGLPIHGIVAFASTTSDKIGRSVPAPGQGITTNARQNTQARFPSPLLNIDHRRKRLAIRRNQIQENLDAELRIIEDESAALGADCPLEVIEEIQYRTEYMKQDAQRQLSEALNTWGNEFWKGSTQISPIVGSLAVWGLTVGRFSLPFLKPPFLTNADDIDFASFHGTSTVMNDTNETQVIQQQLSHLGRREGHPVYGIFQKYLTGHPKGAAGAWMLNGCLQVLDSGLIPGNRAADNIDSKLEKNDLIFFPSRSIQTAGMKAFSVTSFGFGQKGAQAIGIHPKYLFAAIDAQSYEEYQRKREIRQERVSTEFHTRMATNSFFIMKDSPPYKKDQETAVYLNPDARASQIVTPKDGTVYLF